MTGVISENTVVVCVGVGEDARKEATDVCNELGVEGVSEAEEDEACGVTHCELN